MALEVVSVVEAAEEKAVQIRENAKSEAADIIAKAESEGKAAVEAAKKRANEQIAQIKVDLDKQVDDEVEAITAETGRKQKELTTKAQSRMDSAVNTIKERIVTG